jgi:VWFA-related protein
LLAVGPEPHIRRIMRRFVTVLAFGFAVGGGLFPPIAASPADEPRNTATQHIEVRRFVWPVYISPNSSSASSVCAALKPADILVEEDGKVVTVTHLERRPLPVVHALLLDTSNSMRKGNRLALVRQAAIRYVEGLPADEEALVATFDDSMTLVSPRTTIRSDLVDAISGIGQGNLTALWDSVTELVGYLDSVPGNKVLVLLSDGSDSSSLMVRDKQEIFDLVAHRSDLSIFPVGLDMAGEHGPLAIEVENLMRRLATATGGLYLETRGVSKLGEVFERIQQHLSERRYVVYVPTPRGIRDLHRVRVRARPGLPCRVVSGGPARRRDEAPLSVARTVSEQPLAATLHVLDPPGLLSGRIPDVVRDRGVLFDLASYEDTGALETSFNDRAEIVPREIAIDVPGLQTVTGSIRGPEEVLLRLLHLSGLSNDQCPVETAGQDFIVHGKTFLEIRQFIGLALFQHYKQYRTWAIERLVEERRPAIKLLLEELRRENEVSVSQLQTIEQSLLDRVLDPDDSKPQHVLAEWLGDIPAAELSAALELRLANSILDPHTKESEREFAILTAESGWTLLRGWFPPATRVRVVVPLVPAFDERRRVFGFYRVILPSPGLQSHRGEPIPEAPFAVNLIRGLIADGHLPLQLRDGLTLEALEHSTLPQSEQDALERVIAVRGYGSDPFDSRGVLRRTRITLSVGNSGNSAVDLVAYFRQDQERPILLTTCGHGEDSERLNALTRQVAQASSYVHMSCESVRSLARR